MHVASVVHINHYIYMYMHSTVIASVWLCLQVSCKALIGAPLKSNEFLKLEQTHLADIIAEEAGNEHYRAHVDHFEATVDQTKKVQYLLQFTFNCMVIHVRLRTCTCTYTSDMLTIAACICGYIHVRLCIHVCICTCAYMYIVLTHVHTLYMLVLYIHVL